MALVKAQCTECGATIEVNPNATNLTCRYCGSNFIVEKAIKNYNINVNKSNIINNFSGANVTIINNVPEQFEKPKIEYRKLTIFWNKKFRDLGATMTFYCDGVAIYQSSKSFQVKLQVSTEPHVFTATLSDGIIEYKTNMLRVKASKKPLIVEFFNHIVAAPEIAFRDEIL